MTYTDEIYILLNTLTEIKPFNISVCECVSVPYDLILWYWFYCA